MARNLVTVGGEFQVNLLDPLPRSLTPHENGLIGFQSLGSIALLDNGDFVVVYQNDAGGSGDLDIMSIEFTATGKQVGTPFRVDFDIDDQANPDVAPRIGGGYLAVWEDEGASDGIHLVTVITGTPSNPPEFTVADFAESLESPSIATFANGNHIVTYTREFTDNDDVYFAIVNAAGTARVVDNTGLVTTLNLDESNAKVATSGDLAAVVFQRGEFSSDVALDVVNSSGNGVDFQTVADITGVAGQADVAALSDGRFVIVWIQLGTTADVWGRIYDPATKSFSSDAFPIATGGNDEFVPTVAGLPDGGFIVTWTDLPKTGDRTVHARRFDASGAPAGDAFPIVGNPAEITAVAASSDGNVFAAWITGPNAHTTDPDAGIDGQIFRPATETVNGTEGNDTINTYSLNEPINGLGGKDIINAKGGNDAIDGGNGKDILTGGPGLDAFRFDAKLRNSNADHITDFTPAVDKIVLDHSIFTKLKVGELAGKAFFAHRNADEGKNSKDLIVYDTKSGELWYDKDGEGGAKSKLIATLDNHADIGHTDFLVVA